LIIQINKEKGSSKSQELRRTTNGKFNDSGSDIVAIKLNSPIC